MEAERLNTSQIKTIICLQIPDYMDKTENKLQQVLLEIEQFQEKRKLIPYFVKYEFESQKQKMHDFWGKTIEQVMKQFEMSCIFNFNGFYPMSLNKIILELSDQNNFVLIANKLKVMKMLNLDISKLLLEEKEKRKSLEKLKFKGFFSKLNILNYFMRKEISSQNIDLNDKVACRIYQSQRNDNQNTFNNNFEQNNFLINRELMMKQYSKLKDILNSYKWINEHFSFENDIVEITSKEGIKIRELKLFFELLENDGQIKIFGQKETGQNVIFYDKNRISEVNKDYFKNVSVLFLIDYNIQILEQNILRYNEQQVILKKQIIGCPLIQKTKKNQYITEYLILQKTIDNILNKKQTLKKNQLQLEDSIINKRVMKILNQSITTAKQSRIDIQTLEEYKQCFDQVSLNESMVNDIFKYFSSPSKEEQEELDKQIQELMMDNDLQRIEEEQQQNINQFNTNNILLKNQDQQIMNFNMIEVEEILI